MVSFTSLPNEILFQCITNHPDLNNQAIREFASAYCPLRVINQSLRKQIDECWQVCLEQVRKNWKIKEQFVSSKFIVNWIDGTPKVVKQSYKEVQKELVLEFEEPVHGYAYKMLESSDPVLFADSPVENVCYDSYYFNCSKTIAVQVREGVVTFYKLDGMQPIGLALGTDQRKVMPHSDLQPLFLENEVCIFSAKTNVQINGLDGFAMEVYDICTSYISKVKEIELPFYVVSAHAVKDYLVFYCRKDGSYVIGATADRQKFAYSTSLNPPHRSAKLVEIQRQLHFISLKGATLSIQAVEITAEGINLHPVEISGVEQFVLHLDILGAFSHLDKLFVISYDANYKTTLFAINLALKSMQILAPVDFQWLNHGIAFVSCSIGVVKVLIPDRYNPCMLTIDYTEGPCHV